MPLILASLTLDSARLDSEGGGGGEVIFSKGEPGPSLADSNQLLAVGRCCIPHPVAVSSVRYDAPRSPRKYVGRSRNDEFWPLAQRGNESEPPLETEFARSSCFKRSVDDKTEVVWFSLLYPTLRDDDAELLCKVSFAWSIRRAMLTSHPSPMPRAVEFILLGVSFLLTLGPNAAEVFVGLAGCTHPASLQRRRLQRMTSRLCHLYALYQGRSVSKSMSRVKTTCLLSTNCWQVSSSVVGAKSR